MRCIAWMSGQCIQPCKEVLTFLVPGLSDARTNNEGDVYGEAPGCALQGLDEEAAAGPPLAEIAEHLQAQQRESRQFAEAVWTGTISAEDVAMRYEHNINKAPWVNRAIAHSPAELRAQLGHFPRDDGDDLEDAQRPSGSLPQSSLSEGDDHIPAGQPDCASGATSDKKRGDSSKKTVSSSASSRPRRSPRLQSRDNSATTGRKMIRSNWVSKIRGSPSSRRSSQDLPFEEPCPSTAMDGDSDHGMEADSIQDRLDGRVAESVGHSVVTLSEVGQPSDISSNTGALSEGSVPRSDARVCAPKRPANFATTRATKHLLVESAERDSIQDFDGESAPPEPEDVPCSRNASSAPPSPTDYEELRQRRAIRLREIYDMNEDSVGRSVPGLCHWQEAVCSNV